MFANGAYATIWEVNRGKGNYYEVRLSTSKKKDGTYEQDFSAMVRFVGSAANVVASMGKKDRVKIGSCGVTNSYNKEKGVLYTNYVVFECENVSNTKGSAGAQNNNSNVKNEEGYPVNDNAPDDALPF